MISESCPQSYLGEGAVEGVSIPADIAVGSGGSTPFTESVALTSSWVTCHNCVSMRVFLKLGISSEPDSVCDPPMNFARRVIGDPLTFE